MRKRLFLGDLEVAGGFGGHEAHLAVFFLLDKVLCAMVAEELDAISEPDLWWVVVVAVKGEGVDEIVEADRLLETATSQPTTPEFRKNKTYPLQMVASALRRSLGTILSSKNAPKYGVA